MSTASIHGFDVSLLALNMESGEVEEVPLGCLLVEMHDNPYVSFIWPGNPISKFTSYVKYLMWDCKEKAEQALEEGLGFDIDKLATHLRQQASFRPLDIPTPKPL